MVLKSEKDTRLGLINFLKKKQNQNVSPVLYKVKAGARHTAVFNAVLRTVKETPAYKKLRGQKSPKAKCQLILFPM